MCLPPGIEIRACNSGDVKISSNGSLQSCSAASPAPTVSITDRMATLSIRSSSGAAASDFFGRPVSNPTAKVESPRAEQSFVENGPSNKTADSSNQGMVTIRRLGGSPNSSTVTISMKTEGGGEDLLYTLVNGQGTICID